MATALSIIIPAYNEAERLSTTLDQLEAFVARRNGRCEVLIVDDGSVDRTSETVEARGHGLFRLLRQDRNRGKGAALRRGVAESTGALVLLTDADLSTPLSALGILEERMKDAELVLGSRALPESVLVLRQPWHREAMGKTFNRLVRWIVVDGIRDTQCGFKLLRGNVARSLFRDLRIDRFAYDVELVWLARRRGFRVVEAGVPWRDSPQSRVHPVRDASRMFVDVLSIRWRHRREPQSAPGTAENAAPRVLP